MCNTYESSDMVASGHLNLCPIADGLQPASASRADKLIEDWAADTGFKIEGTVDGWSNEKCRILLRA